MKSRHLLVLDLNHLFKPALEEGYESLNPLQDEFKDIHQGIHALKKTGHLPYATLPQDDILADNVILMARKYPQLDNVVVMGIGGSALGASSLYLAIKGAYSHLKKEKKPRLTVVDHIEPDSTLQLLSQIEDQKNLYVIISKSGNTSETLAQYLLLKKQIPDLGKNNLFIITDSHNGCLRDLAVKEDIPCLPIPSGVGGRFSVFSAVGLFPLALAGLNIKDLLDGAAHMEKQCLSSKLEQNPAGLLAMTLNGWIQKGYSQIVLMPYADRLRLVSDWFAQLWGESLGKAKTLDGQLKNVGSTAIKAVGVTDQHSQLQLYLEGPKDKIVLFLEVEEFLEKAHVYDGNCDDERMAFLKGKSLAQLMQAEKLATEECLRENGRPNATIRLSMINEFQLGQLYQLFMNVIPYMGALMNINPFDQPAVERIKKFTFGLMGRKDFGDFADKLKNQPKDKKLIF